MMFSRKILESPQFQQYKKWLRKQPPRPTNPGKPPGRENWERWLKLNPSASKSLGLGPRRRPPPSRFRSDETGWLPGRPRPPRATAPKKKPATKRLSKRTAAARGVGPKRLSKRAATARGRSTRAPARRPRRST